MAQYFYKGKHIASGGIKTGEVLCETEKQVEKYLLEQGILPLKITKKMKEYFFWKIKRERLSFFCLQLGMLSEAGVSIVEALWILHQATKDNYFKRVICQLALEVEKGCFLSESIKKTNLFPDYCTGLIVSGELSGTLGKTLLKLGEHYERQTMMYKKIEKALLYPAIIIGVMLAIGTAIMYFVMPRFTQMFETMDVALPRITQLMMTISQKLHRMPITIILISLLLIVGARLFFNNLLGKKICDQLGIYLPFIKKVIILRQSNIFCETLGTLIGSGVPILKGLQITDGVIGNYVVHKEIQEAIKLISTGSTLGEAFEASKVWPRLLKSMLATAEQIGKLDEVLPKLGIYYYKMLEMKLEKGIVLLEPLLTLVIGVLVGAMIAAIMLPTYTLATQMSW